MLPDDVFTALKSGELVVVLGPRVSAISGLLTGRALWLDLLDRLAEVIPLQTLDSLRATLVAAESTDRIVEPLISLAGRERLIAELQRQPPDRLAKPSRVHQLLAQLPIPTFVDLNWDELMSRALPHAAVFTPRRPQGVAEAHRAGQTTILKPYGILGEPETLALTYQELRRGLSQAPEFERTIAALFSSRTLLFLGSSLQGLEPILRALPPELERGPRQHVAIVPIEPGNDLWQAGLGRRFGVRVASYRASADYHELEEVLQAIADRLSAEAAQTEGTAAATQRLVDRSSLTSVDLASIGIFDSIHVEISPGWTLMLGDNGGGKSTILRSIALALAGNDWRGVPGAARLLRTGEREGMIAIGLGNRRLVTTLIRDGAHVQVRSPQVTPLQAGELLVLAFPALRGVTTRQPKGAMPITAEDPSVADVLPLIDGQYDTRLDDLKQWVVNIALEAETGGRSAAMLKTFTDLIADMVPGGGLTFGRVDRSTWHVVLKAEDYGEVAFDSVSQGMSSILNWIGILLQRLYDVYPRSSKPEHEVAIVLIDEIDAHLHPKWQRQLVTLTRKHFPNVQVVASSHSPLLAGAVKRDELRIVAKDASGHMKAEPPAEDLEGQKAEDILVSSLFELSTTRNVDAEQTIRRYFQLYQKPTRSVIEQQELDRLATKVDSLNYGPTIAEKEALEKIRAQVAADIDAISPEAAQAFNAMLQAAKTSKVEP